MNTVTQSGAMEPPPWRWRAFSPVTVAAGFDDARARELFFDALTAADQLPSVEAMAEALRVSKRTLQRARAWLEAHAPTEYATLRARVSGVVADPRAAAAQRHDRRSAAGRDGG